MDKLKSLGLSVVFSIGFVAFFYFVLLSLKVFDGFNSMVILTIGTLLGIVLHFMKWQW